ncbi:hypothetical protein FF2_024898 [Malus domestica]
MASATTIRTSYLTLSRDGNILKFQLPPCFVDSHNQNTQFRDVSPAISLKRIRLRNESGELRLDIKHRVRVSSNDAQFGLFQRRMRFRRRVSPSLPPRNGSKLWRCLLWLLLSVMPTVS